MLVQLFRGSDCISSVEDTKWRVFSAKLDWSKVADCPVWSVRTQDTVFNGYHLGGASLAKITINGNETIVPVKDAIPTVRLALSCAVLRRKPFAGSIVPILS